MRPADSAPPAPAPATAYLALLFLVGAAYANSFAGVFQFDDYRVVADNPQVASLAAWWASMPGIRPLLKLSYALVEQSGLGLAGHHAFNLALHAANAVLVYLVLRTLLIAPALRNDQAGRPDVIAFGAATLFAVHPIATEAVTMISGRSTALMSGLLLLSALAHLRGRAMASALAFALALASKESAAFLPGLLLLLDRWREPATPWRTHLKRQLPQFFVLLIGALLILASLRYRQLFEIGLATRTPGDNLVTQSAGILYLLSRLLAVAALNADPELPVFSGWDVFWVVTCTLAGGLLVAAILLWPRRPDIAVALLAFFVLLAPTNSLLARLDVANERQLYLAALPLYALAVAAAYRLLAKRRQGYWLALLLVAGSLAVATHQRNQVYRSEASFWADVAEKSPTKARAWNNLGLALAKEGRHAEALAALSHSVELEPTSFRARFNQQRVCRDLADQAPSACGPLPPERAAD